MQSPVITKNALASLNQRYASIPIAAASRLHPFVKLFVSWMLFVVAPFVRSKSPQPGYKIRHRFDYAVTRLTRMPMGKITANIINPTFEFRMSLPPNAQTEGSADAAILLVARSTAGSSAGAGSLKPIADWVARFKVRVPERVWTRAGVEVEGERARVERAVIVLDLSSEVLSVCLFFWTWAVEWIRNYAMRQ